MIAITCMNISLYFLTWLFYRTINNRRAKKWDAMTPDVCFPPGLVISSLLTVERTAYRNSKSI